VQTRRLSGKHAALLAFLAFTGCTLAACSSSPSSTPKGSTPTKSAIKIGLIESENNAVDDETPVRLGVQTAIEYINASLQGLEGHPFDLVSCPTQPTTGGATCANEMVQDKVTVVLEGANEDSAPIYPILKAAGIPVVGIRAVDAADLTSDGNHYYVLGGAIAELFGEVQYLSGQSSIHKVTVLYPNSPPGISGYQGFVQTPLQKVGKTVTGVPADPTATDFTTPMNLMVNQHPDALVSNFSPTACPDIFSAMQQLSVKIPTYFLGDCSAPVILRSAGSEISDSVFTSNMEDARDPSLQSDADIALFKNEAKKYSLEAGPEPQEGFAVMMITYHLFQQAGGASATGSQILSVLKNSNNSPGFMSHSFSCAHPPVAANPTLCDASTMVYGVNADGSLKSLSNGWETP
jgi:branched-chain amino acid transport system substrate-binding protein